MKILVYGAGVLGCNLARNLLRAGKDVTLLARGNWAAEIKQNGLRIKDKFSLRTSVSRIPVVTELAPDVMYDVIFVVLRYTQLDSALDTLRANRTKNIVFVGNNVQARALAAALPEKNVLFAFALSAGHTILPKEDADFEGEKHRKTCLRFFKLMCVTSLGKLCASDHAMNAIDEMSALNRDLKKFFDEHGAAYPVWQVLEAEVGRYLR